MSTVTKLVSASSIGVAAIVLTPLMAWADVSPTSPSSSLEIVGAYGGGGNSGPTADFPNDFVELFNAGSTAQSLSGWSIQNVASDAAGAGSVNWTIPLTTTVTLQPGEYYLWTGYGGGTTPALPGEEPTGDQSSTSSTYDIERYSFTTYLVKGTTAIYSGNSTSATLSVPSGDTVVDELGIGPTLGSYPRFANTAPVGNSALGYNSGGGVSNVTAALRTNVCVNTDDNATDFEIVSPSTSNPYPFKTTASAYTPCSPVTATPETPFAIALPAGAAVVLGGAFLFARRRRPDLR